MKTGTPFPFATLRDLEGVERRVAEAWAEGPALIVIGHRDCQTTRQALPYVDRIHQRRAPGRSVIVVMQDDVETARGLANELGLEAPVRLESDPYPLARDLGLTTVPTLIVVGADGVIRSVYEGFSRHDLEACAAEIGVEGALFAPTDTAPLFRPG
jgi:pimeloyl-ACP methyl ester carboxylesterase